MERGPQGQDSRMPLLEMMTDQDRYNLAYDAADKLLREGQYNPIENPAQLAEAIADTDSRIGYNHALTVVLSLED